MSSGETIEIDVAVLGGGACGQLAALRAAANKNLTVAVFEKSTREGSNAAISSGSLAAGGTRFQAAAGIVDSPETHARDILAASGDLAASDIVHALCESAPQIVEWLADDLDYPIEIGADMPRAGMSVPRLHTDIGRQGGGRLMRALRSAIDARDNIVFIDEAPAVELIVEDDRVVGARIKQNGTIFDVLARVVVLATDGFAANRELMAKHCTDIGQPFYGGVATATGDSVAWLEALGADFRNMGACLRSGLVVVGHGTRVSPALPFNGAVLVDSCGERFVDEESLGYSSMAGRLQSLDGERAAMIFDHIAFDATRDSEMMRECEVAGAIRTADDVEQLATSLGLPFASIEKALDPLPGRRRLEAPFHFAWVTHGVLATQGGAVVDASGHVLRPDGSRIVGLRAGGGVAAGLAGADSSGYVSGNGLLSALGMGWIIGNDLAP